MSIVNLNHLIEEIQNKILYQEQLGDKHFYNVQVLSTQTIGRPGYQSIYSLFYELLDNEAG